MLKYIIVVFVIMMSISCRNTNSEVVVQGKEYLKYNDGFLISMIDEIEKIPNLRDNGHVFIKTSNYRNQKWNLHYIRTKDKNDTVQIDNAIVSNWINKYLLLGVEYDIANRIAYFRVNIENKNGYSIVLVHNQTKGSNFIKTISDTTKFNALGSFKYQIDNNWMIVSPKDPDMRYKDIILHINE